MELRSAKLGKPSTEFRSLRVLNAMFANTLHRKLTQRTSGNKNWHSWIRRTIAILGGMRGLAMIHVFLADDAVQ